MRLFRLIYLASLPVIGLAALSATAGAAPSLQGPSATSGGTSQVQYFETEPAPPAIVPDDDDDEVDANSRCAAQFRSFEPDTGYYTTYDGDRVLCPYLQ
jgi:BA14K-like protein